LGTNIKKYTGDRLYKLFPERYLLFVGQRQGYKNFQTFVKASLPIIEENPSIYVVCIGGGDFNEGAKRSSTM